jgi:hypothetical protein
MDTGFEDHADGKKVEVGVVAGNEDLGQAPKDQNKDHGAGHQKTSKLLRQ